MGAPILTYLDFEEPFAIYMDATDYAVGTALMQTRGNKPHPIANFSKQMSKAQHNYSTTEK